ncbi:MAG: SAM-dependent methyltransferase, partial [Caldimonas sp.]
PSSYFDCVYAASKDPWSFQTSAYEAATYADTVAALGERRFARGFEIGCSIGVLTRLLAARCERLLAVDVNESALEAARRRCADLPHVELRRMAVPTEFAAGPLDLVVMSEVGYYWSLPDLERALLLAEAALVPGGVLLLVHWTPPVPDYPLRGDDVHDVALAHAGNGGPLRAVKGWRRETYRLDLLERVASSDAAPEGRASP